MLRRVSVAMRLTVRVACSRSQRVGNAAPLSQPSPPQRDRSRLGSTHFRLPLRLGPWAWHLSSDPAPMQSPRDSFAAFPEEYDVRNARQHSAAQQQASKQAAQASAIYEYNILRDGAPNYPTLVPTPVAPHPDYPQRHNSSSVNGRSGGYPSQAEEVHLDEHAIEMRQQHHSAITYWGRRVKLCFALHLVTALCLLHSDYCE